MRPCIINVGLFDVNKEHNQIEPWGTSDITGDHSEYDPRIRTLCLLLVKKFLNHRYSCPSIPYLLSFKSRRSWGTLSKAFQRSKNTTSDTFDEFY